MPKITRLQQLLDGKEMEVERLQKQVKVEEEDVAKLAGLLRDKEEDVVRLQTLIKVGKEEINSFKMEFSGKMKELQDEVQAMREAAHMRA